MKRRKKKGSVALAVFVVTILVAIAVGGFLMVSGTLNQINRTSTAPGNVIAASAETFDRNSSNEDTIDADDVNLNGDQIRMMEDDDVKNILLIGQDRREGEERQRSDSMILCSINTKTKKIVLTSFMRDLYVQIPGYSNNRINSVYMFGGMKLLDKVIENNFGIKIDGNVEVDFDGFINALTVVGNLDVALTAEEAWYLNGGNWSDQGTDSTGWNLHEGVNALTPDQALAYTRIRYIGNGDWERTERQRRIVTAAFDKMMNTGNVATMLKLAREVMPYFTTDMTSADILSYIKTIAVNRITHISGERIPVEGYYKAETVDGMDVLIPDLAVNSQLLQSYIYGSVIKKQGGNAGAGNAPALEAESQNTGEGTSEDVSVGTDDAAYSGDGDYYGDNGDYSDYSTDDGSNYDYGETDYSWIVDLDNDGYDDNTGYYYWGG
uniref:Cell envelope-related function transcriptional attenuator common domain n=1 Tax=Eubacterium cellulosolvens (strain ATCC 43171 / JCM 9499 / 6) TaxID=633697 RepID=I5ASN6_EUBC6